MHANNIKILRRTGKNFHSYSKYKMLKHFFFVAFILTLFLLLLTFSPYPVFYSLCVLVHAKHPMKCYTYLRNFTTTTSISTCSTMPYRVAGVNLCKNSYQSTKILTRQHTSVFRKISANPQRRLQKLQCVMMLSTVATKYNTNLKSFPKV